MIKWLSRAAGAKSKSLVPSTIITLVVVAMLILSGPAQAVAVKITDIQPSYTKGSDIEFQVIIDINDPDKYVPVTNISLDLTALDLTPPISTKILFSLDGKRISGDCNIKIRPVSIPQDDFGYGNGFGYDTRTGYGYNFGYGYGYGYGYGGGGQKISFIYNVTIDTDTRCLPPGNYSVVAALNTGKDVTFKSSTDKFRLLPAVPGEEIKARVEIKPETINLASKGKFTAFIRLPEGFDVEDIDARTVVAEGAPAVKTMISKENGGTFIAKFNIQDLRNVHTGNSIKFNVTGELFNGTKFKGSDTVRVIDQGKHQDEDDECECDDHIKEDEHIKEHDHEDECDEHEEEHDHKQIKDHKPEKNKGHDQKNKNNNGQGKNGKNTVINNVYITNNSGTVNVYIDNQGNGNMVNQGSNNKNEKHDSENKQVNRGNNNRNNNNGKSKK